MGTKTFTRGQRVNVEIGGTQIESVFVHAAKSQEAVNAKGAAAADGEASTAIAWVRRSDTGEVEPVDYRLISAV